MLYRLHIGDIEIPIQVIPERRRNARAAFGKDAVLLRIPKHSNTKEKQKHLEWAKNWLFKIYERRPKVFERYRPVHYYNGKLIETSLKTYTLSIHLQERKTIKSDIQGDNIHMILPRQLSGTEKTIGRNLSLTLCKNYKPWVEEKVKRLNKQYFQEEIQNINIRYAATRWGSCNSNGNISISSRSILAPEHILDHIIIHELAHLKEMNHSAAFWKWVAFADPDYQKHDKWISKNGYSLRF